MKLRLPFRISRPSIDDEVDGELEFHLQMRVRELMAQGLSEADARRVALARFGDMKQARQELLRLGHERERRPGPGRWVSEIRQDVVFALRHPKIFSSEMEIHMALGTERPMIPQQIDPPAQTGYRKILDSQFSRQRVLALEPAIRRHANELIDRVVDQGECEFDRAFAIPLPCHAFLALMGLPQADLPQPSPCVSAGLTECHSCLA